MYRGSSRLYLDICVVNFLASYKQLLGFLAACLNTHSFGANVPGQRDNVPRSPSLSCPGDDSNNGPQLIKTAFRGACYILT